LLRFLFDFFQEVFAWVRSVAGAGMPDVVNKSVAWPDEEPVRPAIKAWQSTKAAKEWASEN
jgi:hypothetical protein